jgi:hypothetical protein
MAVLNLDCGGDKENTPPSTARGIAVRKQSSMKSKKASKRRPPLRDITWLLFPSAGPQGAEEEPAAVPDAAVAQAGGAPSDGVAVKQGRYSLVR